jgi:hypothetical protein
MSGAWIVGDLQRNLPDAIDSTLAFWRSLSPDDPKRNLVAAAYNALGKLHDALDTQALAHEQAAGTAQPSHTESVHLIKIPVGPRVWRRRQTLALAQRLVRLDLSSTPYCSVCEPRRDELWADAAAALEALVPFTEGGHPQ